MINTMKINNVNKVCNCFMPDIDRPINHTFMFLGEPFCICTYKFMRGPFGLRGDETPNGYFIMSFSNWLDFRMDVYPERGEVKKRVGLIKRKRIEIPENYEELITKIEAAFLKAVFE